MAQPQLLTWNRRYDKSVDVECRGPRSDLMSGSGGGDVLQLARGVWCKLSRDCSRCQCWNSSRVDDCGLLVSSSNLAEASDSTQF